MICQFLQRCSTPSLSLSLSSYSSTLSLSLSSLSLSFTYTHVCLYVIVYRDLLRIRDRKPIYRGYLRKVSLFVRCEIETLPSAAPSLFSLSFCPLSNCLSLPLNPLSPRGVTTPQWRSDKKRDKMIRKK